MRVLFCSEWRGRYEDAGAAIGDMFLGLVYSPFLGGPVFVALLKELADALGGLAALGIDVSPCC